jgi:hypothetical protein
MANSKGFSARRFLLSLSGRGPFTALTGMKASPVHVEDGSVVLYLASEDGLAEAVVGLMLREERLDFDFQGAFRFRDDGSPAAIEKLIDHARLLECCIPNGEFELWRADSETLLGRRDPIIPMNIDGGRSLEGLRKRREALAVELERRRASGTP